MSRIGSTNKAIAEARFVTQKLKKNREEKKKNKDYLTNEKNITINKDN